MSRSLVPLSLALAVAFAGGTLGACHHDPQPQHAKPGEYPPLPPASGTPVGYIVDAATDLKLRDDQLTKLKDLDSRLAAQDDEVDTQLRVLEKPEVPENEDPAHPSRPQHAPQQRGRRGATHHVTGSSGNSGKPGSAEAAKLHELQDANDRAALKEAFAILDEPQRVSVRKLLLDHGVEPPDEPGVAKGPKPPSDSGGGGMNIPGTDVPGEQ